MLPDALLLASVAAAAPSLADLSDGEARSASVIEACRLHPAACTDAGTREALGRAWYTLVLDDWVHGRPVEPTEAAHVALLTPALYARLPDTARVEGEPMPWVVALTRPPQPAPVAVPAPIVLDDTAAPALPPLVVAVDRYRAGDALEAARLLSPVADDGHPKATALLARALEDLGLDAAALLTLDALLSGPATDRYAPYVTPQAVRLARRIGSGRPLAELAARVPPERWGPDVRDEAWLARGRAHQARGEISLALRAFRRVEGGAAGIEASYRAGVLYRQVDKPWSAVRAFRACWDAESDAPAVEQIRDAAAWHLGGAWEDLARPDDAIGTYEILTLSASPFALRAVVGSARAAHVAGLHARAAGLLDELPPGFQPEADLLRARLALVAGDRAAADAALDALHAAVIPVDLALAELLAEPDHLWTAVRRAELPVAVRIRLDSDLELLDWRRELAAIGRDRAAIARRAPAWRAAVGDALDRRLAAEERALRSAATTALYHAISDLRRELEVLRERAGRLR